MGKNKTCENCKATDGERCRLYSRHPPPSPGKPFVDDNCVVFQDFILCEECRSRWESKSEGFMNRKSLPFRHIIGEQ